MRRLLLLTVSLAGLALGGCSLCAELDDCDDCDHDCGDECCVCECDCCN